MCGPFGGHAHHPGPGGVDGQGVLERTMHAMQLTEACDRFYTYCRRVLQDTEQTLLAMRRARAELAGRITISPPPCR